MGELGLVTYGNLLSEIVMAEQDHHLRVMRAKSFRHVSRYDLDVRIPPSRLLPSQYNVSIPSGCG